MSSDQRRSVFRPAVIIAGLCLLVLAGVLGWLNRSRIFSSEPARWFMPGELGHEPGAATDILTERAFLTRALGALGGEPSKIWAEHNRLTPRLDFSHNFDRVFPTQLFDEHPEFFPLESGRRLRPHEGPPSWQPDLGREDVAAFAAKAARDYFADHPDAVSFALGINDGLNFGESPETTAWTTPVRWFRERPDYSNLVFNFMNRVAARVSSKHPEKYLGALAYYWAENVPDFPVDPHVFPCLTADRSQGYDPEFLQEDRDLQRRWVEALKRGAASFEQGAISGEQRNKQLDGDTVDSAPGSDSHEHKADRLPLTAKNSQLPAPSLPRRSLAKAGSNLPAPSSQLPRLRLGIYDYLYGTGFLIPRQHPHLLAEHLRHTRRLGFTDYYAEVYPNWGLDGPQPWLVAQLLQDPEQSADALLDEYYRRFFKSAAELMRQFFSRCEEQWMNQPGKAYWLKFYRNETQASLFPPEVCRELRHYLDDAAKRADSDLVRARVKQVSDAFGVTERVVAMQTWRERLNRAVLSNEETPAQVWALLTAFREARTEFSNYTQVLQKAQPLLIAPFNYGDYLKHDPTVGALRWLQRQGTTAAELPAKLAADPEVTVLWAALAQPGRVVVRNGQLAGVVQPPRMIADLPFSLALPADWFSRVEPTEPYAAALLGEDGNRHLRLEGNLNTSVYQWNAIGEAKAALAGVKMRGQVSPSCLVSLTLGWLDAGQRHLGVTTLVLPAGSWPEWVELTQAAMVPPGAAWVGVGITVSYQQPGDWVEVKEFSLEAK